MAFGSVKRGALSMVVAEVLPPPPPPQPMTNRGITSRTKIYFPLCNLDLIGFSVSGDAGFDASRAVITRGEDWLKRLIGCLRQFDIYSF